MPSVTVELHTRRHHPFRYLYRSPKANPIKAAVYANLSKLRKQDPSLSELKYYDIAPIAGEINRAILRTVRDILIKNGLYPLEPDGNVDEHKIAYIRERYRMRFDIKATVDFEITDEGVDIKGLKVEEFHYQIRLEVANVTLPQEALEQIERREVDVTEMAKLTEEEEEEEEE